MNEQPSSSHGNSTVRSGGNSADRTPKTAVPGEADSRRSTGTLQPQDHAGADLDRIIEDAGNRTTRRIMLHQLAEHYNISPSEIINLLIGPQVAYLHMMTDFNGPRTKEVLLATVRNQHARTQAYIEEMRSINRHVQEALAKFRSLEENAGVILAKYRDQLQIPVSGKS